tara:strand:+ start:1410 stop:2123 length:714 start_codon:yes stop_codon:yes gene_type:complete
MSQNDLVISNQNFPATRADINNALQALGSSNSGSSAPATTYANMLWCDTSANIIKIRSEANDAWISIGYLDQAAGAFSVFDDTKLVNASGTQVGLLGDQDTATWEGGTGTLESLISPAKLNAASSSVTLLGTLNLTSGSTQTLSGITLSNYKILYLVIDAVNVTLFATLSLEGGSLGSVNNDAARYMFNGFDVGYGKNLKDGMNTAAGINISSATSLALSLSTGSFTSGTAKFYGAK